MAGAPPAQTNEPGAAWENSRGQYHLIHKAADRPPLLFPIFIRKFELILK
jgi:hypothetical protein